MSGDENAQTEAPERSDEGKDEEGKEFELSEEGKQEGPAYAGRLRR